MLIKIKFNLYKIDQIFCNRPPPLEKKRLRSHDIEGFTIYYLKKLFMTPYINSHSTTEPKLEMLSVVSTENRLLRAVKMYVALCMDNLTIMIVE